MRIAIVTAADKGYLPGVNALYNSFNLNSGLDCKFFLLAHGDPKDFERVNIGIQIIYNRETVASPTSSHWPLPIPAMYSRLLIPEIFKDYDRVLWLDADTIILEDLTPLVTMNMENKPCACAWPGGPFNDPKFNFMPPQFESPEEFPEYKDVPSVQAGVILFDINKWNKLNLNKVVNKVLVSNIKFNFVVQGVLGYVLAGNFKRLDYRWNYYTNWAKSIEDIRILHYVGGRESTPWTKRQGKWQKLWEQYE